MVCPFGGFPTIRHNEVRDLTASLLTEVSHNVAISLKSAYKRHKDAKKCEYGHRVRDIEHGVFTPLVFSSTGGMGCEATVFYRRLADMLTTHWGQDYSQTIS